MFITSKVLVREIQMGVESVILYIFLHTHHLLYSLNTLIPTYFPIPILTRYSTKPPALVWINN